MAVLSFLSCTFLMAAFLFDFSGGGVLLFYCFAIARPGLIP
jgi:hypothetical protein